MATVITICPASSQQCNVIWLTSFDELWSHETLQSASSLVWCGKMANRRPTIVEGVSRHLLGMSQFQTHTPMHTSPHSHRSRGNKNIIYSHLSSTHLCGYTETTGTWHCQTAKLIEEIGIIIVRDSSPLTPTVDIWLVATAVKHPVHSQTRSISHL